MTVTVVYDNSEATELCAAQHLYLKPIAKLMINVLLPESTEPMRPFSNWEVLDQLKSLICPDQFTTVRLSKSTKNFIRFEGEAETQSLVQILKAKLHGKIIKLNGLKTDLKVVATDAQREWEHLPQEQEAPSNDGVDELDCNKSPYSIHFQGLPCKWFAPKGSSGEKPCEEILRVVFESFGKIKNVDIPMLDPYREVMTGRSFGGFNFGLQTFEAFIQYQESTDFIKAMESLRGMKLMLKGDDGKALACNIKVTFDTTKHFSEGAIRRRNQERLKLQELEEERRKEKKREEEAESDPVIDESLSESSGSVEVLDTSDEEKKKSKFKAFKDFFGKRKKREPVDVYRGRSLISSFSSLHFNNSSLNMAQEGQQSKSRVKGNMETKSLSHESTFMLDPEPEIPASKTNPSPELQRGRSLERSHVSRTLSGAGGMRRTVSGALHEVVPRYVSRSGIWVAGSKITEIPPMRPHQPSIRPPVTGSEAISKDFEKISVDAQPPKTPRKVLSQKILSLKSSFEPSSGPVRSQSLTTFAVPTSSSSTQLPIGFSTPATTQDCLDSSASEHKMALNPRKQKKKNSQATVKPKQEELSLPLVSEEKSKTRPKATHEKKPKKDSAGPLTQEKSNNTEISKTTDQATKTDATGSQGYSAYGRQSGKKGLSASGKSESRPRGRSSKRSSRRLDLGNRARSPSADKIARDSHFRQLPLEKKVTEQPIALQVEATTPQELLSDKNYMERRKAGLDYETRKASVSHSIPKHMKASMISGPSQYHEDGASGTKSEAGASLLSVVESPSAAQENVMFSVAGEAQVCMGPSRIQSEEEKASSFDSQSVKFKMESAQDISNTCKRKPPGNVLQAFPASILGMASDLAERGISAERLPPGSLSRSLGKPEAEEVSSDVDSTSEIESGSEQQLAPGYFLQSSGDPEDDEEGFAESSSFVRKLSSSHEQLVPSHASLALGEPEDKVSTKSKSYFEKYNTAKDWSSSEEDLPPRHSSRSLGKPEAEEVSSDADITSEMESGFEQKLTPGYFLHSSGEPEDEKRFSDSESASEKGSGSKQQLVPSYAFQSSGEPEDDEEGFAESSSFVGKLSSSHEQLALSCASQALGESKDEVSTESNSYLEKYNPAKGWSSSEEDLPPRHSSLALGKPKDQKEVFSVSKSRAEEWGVSVEQVPPRRLPQPLVRPFVQQQLSSGSMNVSSEWVPMPSRHTYQAWLKPKPKQQASTSPESTALEWAIAMEPLPPRVSSRRQLRRKVEQPVSSGPEITTIEGITSMELPPPGTRSQPLVKPISEQEISAGPESMVVEGRISMEPVPPKLFAHPLMNPKVEQNVFLGSEGAEKVISVEPPFSECPQCLTNPEAQHIISENTTGNEGMFVELLPPKCPCQPLVKLNLQPENITCDSGSASKEGRSPMEVMPPRHTFYPHMNTSFEQPSAGPKSTAVEWGIPMEPLLPRMPSQPLMRPVAQQKVFEHSLNAPAQWSGLVEPIRPTYTFQPWVRPKYEQQAHTGPESTVAESSTLMEPLQPRVPSEALRKPISAGPESVANERDTSTELPPPRHWSIVRHKVQKMSPRFEKAAVERVISGRAQPPKYPIHFLNFEGQEVSSDLQNTAVEGGMSKKLVLSRCPSQSFVKYMAQHIFSESPDKEQQVYVVPLASNLPSKSLLGPKVEHQVFSGWESADIEGSISSKLLPMKCPLQSLERPENPQEVFSYSENAPMKWSCPQEQRPPRYLSQTYGKFEHKQEVSSVSQRSLEEWRCSEVQQPSRCTFQAEGGAEFQPQVLSTGSVSVPIECSSAGHHLPPRQPFQAFAGPEYQQQVYSSSMSVAAKATIFESNPSSCSLPRGPASPNETGKHSQGSEDLIKNILTSATKPVKSTVTPAWPTSISGDSYPKDEVLESSDRNDGCSSLSTSEADVENLFGVRLRRIPSSQKYKSKEQEHFTKLPSPSLGPISTSVGREPQIRSASKELLHTEENPTEISDFADKQQSKPKSDSIPKKQPAYKIPGKADQQSDYATSEPAWITMAKQKQRKFQTEITMEELKASNRAGPETETKVAGYEGAGHVYQNQPRKIFPSNVNRQEKIEQMTLPKSIDPGFENPKIFQVPAMRKETRYSSAHPAVFQEPVEPVWFSMAKKKAKAWSYITEIMQ
ncbi:acrosomal protein KIAA1210 homolog [Glossophaga mutica]